MEGKVGVAGMGVNGPKGEVGWWVWRGVRLECASETRAIEREMEGGRERDRDR